MVNSGAVVAVAPGEDAVYDPYELKEKWSHEYVP